MSISTEIRHFNGVILSSLHKPRVLLDAAPNKAHALMFLGRPKDARELYLKHKGQQIEGRLWEDVILDDFAELETAGVSHPQMAEIRAALRRD